MRKVMHYSRVPLRIVCEGLAMVLLGVLSIFVLIIAAIDRADARFTHGSKPRTSLLERHSQVSGL